jgi:uncharacterized protein YukE
MKKAVFRKLLAIAKAVVQQVQNMITAQINVVQTDVEARINRYIQEVVNDMWQGRGADAFVQAIQSDVTPKIAQITQKVTQTNRNIATAVQIMDEADTKVTGIVNKLRDTIDKI